MRDDGAIDRTARIDEELAGLAPKAPVGRIKPAIDACSCQVVPSGDDVGTQPVLDVLDLILDRKLALFQPLDAQLIGKRRHLEGRDFAVKFTVLVAQTDQFLAQISFITSRRHIEPLPLKPGP